MTTLTNLTTEVRRRIGETSTAFFADAEITSLLNEGQRVLCSEGGVIEGDAGIALVAKQYIYDLPSSCNSVHHVLFEEKDKLQHVTFRVLYNMLRKTPGSPATPQFYTVQSERINGAFKKRLWVHPAPSASSASTTLNGAHTASVSTITVADTSGFSTSGHLKVNSEEVRYYDLTSTTFVQTERGVGGTTAAAHSDTDAVSELDLRIYFYRDPVAMSAGGDSPDMPPEFHEMLVHYAAGMLKIKDQLYDQGSYFLGLWDRAKLQVRDEIKKKQRDVNPKFYPGDRGYQTRLGPP